MLNKTLQCRKAAISQIKGHKVLHKVRKHWVTVSLFALGLIGGTLLAGGTTASANSIPTHTQVTPHHQTAQANQSAVSIHSAAPQSQGAQVVGNISQKIASANTAQKTAASQSNLTKVQSNKPTVALRLSAPRMLQQNNHAANNLHSTDELAPQNVQQTATGTWGSAKWNFYKNGQLDIHDGDMENNTTPQGINAPAVKILNTYNVTAPADCDGLFGGLTWVKGNQDQGGQTNASLQFRNLQDADMSGLDTSHTTSMRGMFHGDTHLSNLKFSNNFNTSNVTSFAAMFDDDSSLPSLNLSSFDTNKANDYTDMFWNMPSLRSLDLQSFTMKPGDNVSNMFNIGPWGHPNGHTQLQQLITNDSFKNIHPGDAALNNVGVDNIPEGFTWSDAINHPGDYMNRDDSQTYTVHFLNEINGQSVGTSTTKGIYRASFLPIGGIRLPSNYQLAPNAEPAAHVENSDTAVVGVVPSNAGQYGIWGNASWILHDNGHLDLLNGNLETNHVPLNLLNMSDGISSITARDVTAPGDASNLFNDFDNVRSLDLSSFDDSRSFNQQNVFGDSAHRISLGSKAVSTGSTMAYNATNPLTDIGDGNVHSGTWTVDHNATVQAQQPNAGSMTSDINSMSAAMSSSTASAIQSAATSLQNSAQSMNSSTVSSASTAVSHVQSNASSSVASLSMSAKSAIASTATSIEASTAADIKSVNSTASSISNAASKSASTVASSASDAIASIKSTESAMSISASSAVSIASSNANSATLSMSTSTNDAISSAQSLDGTKLASQSANESKNDSAIATSAKSAITSLASSVVTSAENGVTSAIAVDIQDVNADLINSKRVASSDSSAQRSLNANHTQLMSIQNAAQTAVRSNNLSAATSYAYKAYFISKQADSVANDAQSHAGLSNLNTELLTDLQDLDHSKANTSDMNDMYNANQQALSQLKDEFMNRISAVMANAQSSNRQSTLWKNQLQGQYQQLQKDLAQKADWTAVGKDEANVNKIAGNLNAKVDFAGLETALNAVVHQKQDAQPTVIDDPNTLQVNQQGMLHQYVITALPIYHNARYLYLLKNTVLHTSPIFQYGKSAGTLKAKDHATITIQRAFMVQHNGHKVFRIEVRYGSKNYYITGNHHYVRNSYVQPHDLSSHHTVLLRRGAILYHGNYFDRQHRVRNLRAGSKLHVQNVIMLPNGMTRLYVGHNLYVTANKNYVKVV